MSNSQLEQIIRRLKARLLKIAYRAYKKKIRAQPKISIFMSGVRATTNCIAEIKIRKVLQPKISRRSQIQKEMPKSIIFPQAQTAERKITLREGNAVRTPDLKMHKNFMNLQSRNVMIRRSQFNVGIKDKLNRKERLISKIRKE